MNYYRQGDLGITPILKLPANLKELKKNILAYGEATGHKHQLVKNPTKHFRVLEDKNGNKYLDIKGATDLVHEEHKTITIQPGFYVVNHEKEYNYFDEEIKRVQD